MGELILTLGQQSIGRRIACFASAKSTIRGPNDNTQNDQLDIMFVVYQKLELNKPNWFAASICWCYYSTTSSSYHPSVPTHRYGIPIHLSQLGAKAFRCWQAYKKSFMSAQELGYEQCSDWLNLDAIQADSVIVTLQTNSHLQKSLAQISPRSNPHLSLQIANSR
jgi:hypothetical protein